MKSEKMNSAHWKSSIKKLVQTKTVVVIGGITLEFPKKQFLLACRKHLSFGNISERKFLCIFTAVLLERTLMKKLAMFPHVWVGPWVSNEVADYRGNFDTLHGRLHQK